MLMPDEEDSDTEYDYSKLIPLLDNMADSYLLPALTKQHVNQFVDPEQSWSACAEAVEQLLTIHRGDQELIIDSLEKEQKRLADLTIMTIIVTYLLGTI